ncbi:TRAP transporter substrate-binding protein [Pseudovibrio sp. SPO723]|nr:TRAP transporter substrate-binding protein [Pseudovibrio sp. SPO723]MDX5595200.1 TRAP transporter substrate-binding protein [Pseudovibrio sp. SPO723]
MKTLGALSMLAASALPAIFAVGAANAADYTFKLHHFLSNKAPAHAQMLEPWARAVAEKSGGKVSIEIFPSMTLGGRPPELVSQARDGVVDLVWTLNGYTPGLFPRTEVMELPLVYVNDPKAANLALNDLFESDLKQEYKGLEVMFLHVHAGNGIQMRDKEVRSPEDLSGTALRTPSRTGAWVIEALGASPAAMPVPDLPQALQKGVIDGAFIPWEIIPPLKIQEQTQYQIEGAANARFGTAVFQVSMNKARWDSLPNDVQQAFREASNEEWLAQVGEIWRNADDFGIGLAEKAGNTHIILTDEETAVFNEALAPVVDRWVAEVSSKGIDGPALVEKARAAIAKHSGQ